jgi:hypothetical protein
VSFTPKCTWEKVESNEYLSADQFMLCAHLPKMDQAIYREIWSEFLRFRIVNLSSNELTVTFFYGLLWKSKNKNNLLPYGMKNRFSLITALGSAILSVYKKRVVPTCKYV